MTRLAAAVRNRGEALMISPDRLAGTFGRAPDWSAVEALLDGLAANRTRFSTAISGETWISAYDRGRRLRLESGPGSRWVDIEHIKTCWETFERLGRINRRDVLDPGRCAAFMIALFRQVAGIHEEEEGEEPYLVLPER
jgi:hypothetical protein